MRSLLKKSFFVDIFVNIYIFRRSIFPLRSLRKNHFNLYVLEYQHFEENYEILISLWKQLFFAQISLNINISRTMTIFWDPFEKIVICSNLLKYQYIKETYVFLNSYWNNHLIAISSQISTFWGKLHYFEITLKRGKGPIFEITWKNRFLPISPKYQHFEAVILSSLWKNHFMPISL